jgi:hypothetical protein
VVRHIEGDRSDQCVDLGIAPPRRLVKLLAKTTQEEHVSIRAQPFGR